MIFFSYKVFLSPYDIIITIYKRLYIKLNKRSKIIFNWTKLQIANFNFISFGRIGLNINTEEVFFYIIYVWAIFPYNLVFNKFFSAYTILSLLPPQICKVRKLSLKYELWPRYWLSKYCDSSLRDGKMVAISDFGATCSLIRHFHVKDILVIFMSIGNLWSSSFGGKEKYFVGQLFLFDEITCIDV